MDMHFYYHPILGLQYKVLEPPLVVIDLERIPKNFNVKEFISRWKNQGVLFLKDSTKEITPTYEPKILSNIFFKL